MSIKSQGLSFCSSFLSKKGYNYEDISIVYTVTVITTPMHTAQLDHRFNYYKALALLPRIQRSSLVQAMIITEPSSGAVWIQLVSLPSMGHYECIIVDEVVTLPTGLIVFILFHWVSDYRCLKVYNGSIRECMCLWVVLYGTGTWCWWHEFTDYWSSWLNIVLLHCSWCSLAFNINQRLAQYCYR